MKNVQKQKRANKSLPFFFRDEFRVSLVIILISVALLITTFTFDIVPPILNRGIQPATFPKALLVLIIVMTLLIYYLATKNPWKVEKKLPRSFFLTLSSFVIFVVVSKTLDFFLAISAEIAKKKSSVLETTTKITKLDKVRKNDLGNFFSTFQGFLVAK